MSPEFAEALRKEIQNALDAGGRPFSAAIAHRVYDLAMAAKDLMVAAVDTVEEAVNVIQSNNGPLDSLMAPNASPAPVLVAESYGARLMREILAALPAIMHRPNQDDPKALVAALAEARAQGLEDVAQELEKQLLGTSIPTSASAPTVDDYVQQAKDEEQDEKHGRLDGEALHALKEPRNPNYLRGYTAGLLARKAELLPSATTPLGEETASVPEGVLL